MVRRRQPSPGGRWRPGQQSGQAGWEGERSSCPAASQEGDRPGARGHGRGGWLGGRGHGEAASCPNYPEHTCLAAGPLGVPWRPGGPESHLLSADTGAGPTGAGTQGHCVPTDTPMQTPALPGHPALRRNQEAEVSPPSTPQKSQLFSCWAEKAFLWRKPLLPAQPPPPQPHCPLPRASLISARRGVRAVGTAGGSPWESGPAGFTSPPGDSPFSPNGSPPPSRSNVTAVLSPHHLA